MRNYFLKTERIGFGIWLDSDIDNAKKLWLNPNVTRYISANGKFSEEDVNKRLSLEISNQEKYQVQYWPIFLLETNEFIGCCGLRPYDLDNGIYEFGVHIIDQFWNSGYASETGLKVIDYAFNNLKAKNLFAGHNPKNNVSKKMLEKLGFKYFKDEYYEPTGLNHPSYLLK
ncbi:ribosomal-protein-alanine N-acetyltransferase [Bacilli bacterium PM5-9]|nr:ribosomal-protein-alanine N-acetyltransferase [Bacilli bacterium PM5-9]